MSASRCGPRAVRRARRCWCSTPRPAGGRPDGRPRCRPLILGAGSLGVMVAGHELDRPPDRSCGSRRVQRQVARIVEGDFQELPLERPSRRGRGPLPVDQPSVRPTEGHAADDPARPSDPRLLAQFAAGLAHQLRNALTGARMSVQLHARRYPAPADDQTLSVALRQLAMTEEQVKGLLSLGRVESRPPTLCDLRPAPRGGRHPGRPGVPARRGRRSSSPARRSAGRSPRRRLGRAGRRVEPGPERHRGRGSRRHGPARG